MIQSMKDMHAELTRSCGTLEQNQLVSLVSVLYCSYFKMLLYMPPLWSSGQSYWLQIQGSGYNSRRYQIFWEVVGLEWGPLSLVSITEELLERKISVSCLEIREYSRRDSSPWPRDILCPQTLALIWPTSSSCSVGLVRSRTQATEFSLVLVSYARNYNVVRQLPVLLGSEFRQCHYFVVPNLTRSWFVKRAIVQVYFLLMWQLQKFLLITLNSHT
jgi:hypothetical protein